MTETKLPRSDFVHRQQYCLGFRLNHFTNVHRASQMAVDLNRTTGKKSTHLGQVNVCVIQQIFVVLFDKPYHLVILQ
jgi:hypothetical protein